MKSGPHHRIWLARLICLVAGLVAFRSLFEPFTTERGLSQAEQFFYDRSDSVWVALAAAAWLAWRRIDRLRALEHTTSPGLAAVCWSLGAVCFVWARLVDANDLMVLGLVALAVGVVVQAKGLNAIRVLAPALLVALLSIPLPAPVYNEVVWAAQRAATLGSYELLHAMGFSIEMSDMALNHEGHVFWVIESCSGLRAVELLTISAILIRELLGPQYKRLWWLVVAAPLLALAFNVSRIAAIVALQSGQVTAEGHVAQGLISVFAGTILLVAAGHLMLPSASARHTHRSVSREVSSDLVEPRRVLGDREWVCTAIYCVALAMLSIVIQPWPVNSGEPPSIDVFEQSRPGWEAERTGALFYGVGDLPKGEAAVIRFERSAPEVSEVEAVELRLVAEAGGTVRQSLRASRLDTLGPEWRTESLGGVHLWQIDRQARVSLSQKADIQALSYRWVCSNRSWLGAVLDSALALRRVPGRHSVQPLDLRVTTIVPGDGSPGRRERARRVLDSFVTDFGPLFRRLEAECGAG